MTSTAAAADAATTPRRPHPNRGFWIWTSLIAAGGLVIRIMAVLGRPNRSLGGDAYYFHHAANLLVGGQGFIDPFYYYGHNLHMHIQTASWPPGFVWVLAMASVVGFKSYFAQRIWCGVVGAAAVVTCAMAGREIGGRRVGVMTALIIALNPNIWMSNEPALSETLTPLLVGLVLWSAYRFWKEPGVKWAVVMAVCLAFTALSRDELTTLFVLLALPLCLLARGCDWRRRFVLLGVTAAAALVVIGPWVGYNMSRFSNPVFISDGLGVTLASADCGPTWGTGRFEAFWDLKCALAVHLPKVGTDETVGAADEQRAALTYIRHHLGRLVPISGIKIARGFGFFRPYQQVEYDYFFDGRPYRWAMVGLWSYYVLLATSIGGFVVLVRRKVTTLPLVAVTVATVLTMVVAFGDTRYRTPFEVVLAILASVAVDGLLNVVGGRRRPQTSVEPGPPPLDDAALVAAVGDEQPAAR